MTPAQERHRLVEHLRAAGLTDERVLHAVEAVPRERFVPAHLQRQAHEDEPLPIGHGQTISQPYVVAAMTEALGLGPTSRVLEIGTGSGYQAAVLARLAGTVVSVERVPELADRARTTLRELGVDNVTVHTGDGTLGRPTEAPFDAIIVTAAEPSVPAPLLAQLADDGVLVAPVGPPDSQVLLRLRRDGNHLRRTELGGVRFVPLVPDVPVTPDVPTGERSL